MSDRKLLGYRVVRVAGGTRQWYKGAVYHGEVTATSVPVDYVFVDTPDVPFIATKEAAQKIAKATTGKVVAVFHVVKRASKAKSVPDVMKETLDLAEELRRLIPTPPLDPVVIPAPYPMHPPYIPVDPVTPWWQRYHWYGTRTTDTTGSIKGPKLDYRTGGDCGELVTITGNEATFTLQ